jgi:hypothetical protein
MDTKTIAKQLKATGLFDHTNVVARDAGSQDAPIEAQINADGHDLLARLGQSEFRLEVTRRAPACALAAPGWILAAPVTDVWPADTMTDPRASPPILSHLESDATHRLLLDIRPGLSWFDGHFPGQPILAGVVQLHLAALLAQRLYRQDFYPRKITRLKFQHLVIPPRILELTLEDEPQGRIRFRYRGQGRDHSQGRLHFGGGEE